VRTFRHHPVRLARALVVASIVVAAGCGGGSGGSAIPGAGNNNNICDFNAQSITIARPTPGFGQNGNTIEIVSSSGSDDLHSNPSAYDLNLRDNFNNVIITGPLSLVPDPNGPHPYTSDFYYQGTLQSPLQGGLTYNVFLNAPNSNCTPGFVGSFST
jgi:hypothetical protein